MAAKKKTKKGETASDRWQAASKKWRNHVLVVPMAGGKRRLHLTGVRWRFKFKDGEEQTGIARDIQTDPDPSARDLLDLHHLAGEFEAVGLQLADAAAGIASDLVSTDALNLAKIMRRAPRRPTLAQFDLVEQVDLQVEHLAVRRGRPARLLTPMQRGNAKGGMTSERLAILRRLAKDYPQAVKVRDLLDATSNLPLRLRADRALRHELVALETMAPPMVQRGDRSGYWAITKAGMDETAEPDKNRQRR